MVCGVRCMLQHVIDTVVRADGASRQSLFVSTSHSRAACRSQRTMSSAPSTSSAAALRGPLGGLQADIVASKRRAGAAEVVFRKDAPLTDDDIAAMSSAMRTANTLIKPVGSTLAWAIRARGLLQTPSHACRADIPCCQCVSAFAPLHTCWSWFKSSSYQSLLCCFTYHS